MFAASDSRPRKDFGGVMRHRFQWWGNLSVSAPGPSQVPTLESFELDGRYLSAEKQILIDALTDWIWSEESGWAR
jgi:hypothetical protein